MKKPTDTKPHHRSRADHNAHVTELICVGHAWGHTDPALQMVYKTMLARVIIAQIKLRQEMEANQLLH